MILNVYKFAELEWDARRLICTCAPCVYGPYPATVYPKRYIPHCSQCSKPRIQYAHLCELCEEYFIKDFKHPGFCYRSPRCWNCLDQNYWCNHCMDGWSPTMLAIQSEIRPPRIKQTPVADDNFEFKILDFG